ncbi:MAG TPA: Uma2 family endonuclease [Gemmatimonadales bacterium]
MPALPAVTTIEELLALPDDGLRHELLDGEHVVTPSPAYRHQDILAHLFFGLASGLAGRPDIKLLTSPADVRLGPRTLVQPDLFVVPIDPKARPKDWRDLARPILAIEILSPRTARRDRGSKRRIYQRAGIAEYWIVDPDARLVERWRPDDARPEILDQRITWAVDATAVVTVELAGAWGE